MSGYQVPFVDSWAQLVSAYYYLCVWPKWQRAKSRRWIQLFQSWEVELELRTKEHANVMYTAYTAAKLREDMGERKFCAHSNSFHISNCFCDGRPHALSWFICKFTKQYFWKKLLLRLDKKVNGNYYKGGGQVIVCLSVSTCLWLFLGMNLVP